MKRTPQPTETQNEVDRIEKAQADIRAGGAQWTHWESFPGCEPIVFFTKNYIDSSLPLSCVTPDAVLEALRDSLAMLNIARDLERSGIL